VDASVSAAPWPPAPNAQSIRSRGDPEAPELRPALVELEDGRSRRFV